MDRPPTLSRKGFLNCRVSAAALSALTEFPSPTHAAGGTKLYVITEADRSVTTVLLPDEY